MPRSPRKGSSSGRGSARILHSKPRIRTVSVPLQRQPLSANSARQLLKRLIDSLPETALTNLRSGQVLLVM